MKKICALATLAFATLVGTGLVHGSPMIRLSDGTTLVEVNDNDANDANANAGAITFVGAVGTNWLSNMTTGESGAPSDPLLRLTGLHATNVGGTGVSLDVWLTDTSFTLGSAATMMSLLGYIQGQTNGMVTWSLYADTTKTAFGNEHLIDSDTNTTVDFTDSLAGVVQNASGPFSMTLHVRINHGNGERTSSFNFEGVAQLVPEPGTMLLLGAGLAVLALRRRA